MLDQISLRYYRMLRFPASLSRASKYLYLGLLVLILSIYVFDHGLDEHIKLYVAFFHILAWTVLPLFLRFLVPYMKLRQCVNMSMFLLVPGVPIELAGKLVMVPGLVYAVVPIIGVLAVRGFTHSKTRSVMVAFYTVLLELLAAALIDGFAHKALLMRASVTFAPMALSVYYMESLPNNGDIDVYKLANSWIKLMLLNDEGDFSLIMNRIGNKENIATHIILFDDTNEGSIALIVPEIHFGPFRRAGSAALPHVLDEIFDKINSKVFVLHSAGSHERNLVSTQEALSYGQKILEKVVAREGFEEDAMFEPFRVYGKYFEAFVFQTNSKSYIIVSSPIRGNDDIPYQVQTMAAELGESYGFKDVAVIDAHNIEGPSISDPDKYTDILIAALSKNSNQCVDFGVGYGESTVKGFVQGLCSNKVKVLTLKCNESLYGLVYLYGNNAQAGVRDALRRVALELGFSDVEVVTADDHSCSGNTFDAPYYAVGLHANLVKAVESALNMSIRNIKNYRMYSAKLITENMIVGSKIFYLLELAKTVGRKVLRFIVISHILTYTLVVALLYVLNI